MIGLDHRAIRRHHSGDFSVFFQNFSNLRPEMNLSTVGDDPVSQILNNIPQHICSDMGRMIIEDRSVCAHLHECSEDFSISSRGILHQCI